MFSASGSPRVNSQELIYDSGVRIDYSTVAGLVDISPSATNGKISFNAGAINSGSSLTIATTIGDADSLLGGKMGATGPMVQTIGQHPR